MYQTFIERPVFNLLEFIYALVPGHDLGVAIILFTVVIRLIMWPLVKKQLHHSKAMRKLQPELKKIKQAAKGDRQKEARLQMEQMHRDFLRDEAPAAEADATVVGDPRAARVGPAGAHALRDCLQLRAIDGRGVGADPAGQQTRVPPLARPPPLCRPRRPCPSDALERFDDLLNEHRVRPTVMAPLWRLAGFGLGGCIPVDYALVGEFTPRKQRGRVLTAMDGWWPVGAALCGFVSAWLVAAFADWRDLPAPKRGEVIRRYGVLLREH